MNAESQTVIYATFAVSLLIAAVWILIKFWREERAYVPPPPEDKKFIPSDLAKKIRDIEIRTRRVVDNVFSGEYHTIFKGRGMEFAESRPYQPGDDIRTMDWNVTARTGEPFVKLFREERELTIMLMADFSASGGFGSGRAFKSEVAAELCAALAFSAIKNNDKVGLIGFTDKVELFIPPKKGRSNVLRLIRELLYFKPEGKQTDIDGALRYLNLVAKKKTITFLVSDFNSKLSDKTLKACSVKHDLIAVRIIDPREEKLPPAGYITLKDAETEDVIVVDTSNPTLRREYESAAKGRAETLARMFRATGVDQILIRTDQPFTAPLIRFFKEREKKLGIR